MTIRPMTGIVAVSLVLFPLLFSGLDARPQNDQSVTYPQTTNEATAETQAALAYWTPERMTSAEPMPMPQRLVENLPPQQNLQVFGGTPGFVNGWQPGSGEYVRQVQTFPRAGLATQGLLQAFGTAPTNPLAGPYGPFQRFTMQGHYLAWPRAIHGKLFFSQNGGNFVCSASVIGRSTLVTAGHCVSDGSSTFSTDFMFCPGYFQGGVHPQQGCWSWAQAFTSAGWHFSGNLDHDYACIVTPVTGTVRASRIGDVTGWAGYAWNWNDVPVVTFGYPAGAPFPGNIIQETVSTEWYNVDWVAGGQVSKAIGSDLTGGSSGGGWFLSWRAPGAEVVDTDANGGTDPAGAQNGPYINGVNSAKRCITNCNTPPTAGAGLFWQEMVSPPFRNTAATDESQDVLDACLGHPNNTSAPASASAAALAKVRGAVVAAQK